MGHRILLTGVSGYLGGTVLNRLAGADLPPYEKLYAVVRNKDQTEAVKQQGAEPLTFDLYDEKAVQENVKNHGINIVYFLIDAFDSTRQVLFIKALAELKKSTGQDVHFLHTTGAKVFSSHCGGPVDRQFTDSDSNLYDIQKAQRSRLSSVQKPIETNNIVTELSESLGVRSYIFAPCIVYGKSEGFGNPISIQTKAIVQAAKQVKKVYKVDEGRAIWPVCHVIDTATLYIHILRQILAGEDPGHGKQGYYLASSGSVAWEDIYKSIAKSMHKRGVITDDEVLLADETAVEKMASALDTSKEMVAFQVGGICLFTARHGVNIGWRPQFPAEHVLEAMDYEVEIILKELGGSA